jgi:hypothetical protein
MTGITFSFEKDISFTNCESKAEHLETAYLLSSVAKAQRLEQAKKEFESGQWVEVENLDELFK